ncbi:MAG: MBL fold metallo-hydrolase [Thermoplasmata archaeon]|jgi:glyoxylase-like metal-dependent hydrolase (beta-lactamase superfamily II)
MEIISEEGMIDEDIMMVDVNGWLYPKTTSSFIIYGKEIGIFDPGGRTSGEKLIKRLNEMKISGKFINFFVSHRHADHSAGAAYLINRIKNGIIHAHPITIANLINPDKINKATVEMYGNLGEIIEYVNNEYLHAVVEPSKIDLGNGHVIEVINTPGHTSDHLMYYDEKSQFLFLGDGAGLFSPESGIPLPNSFPPSFKYEEYRKSLLKIMDYEPKIIGFSHYGSVKGSAVKKILNLSIEILDDWYKIFTENDRLNAEQIIFEKYSDDLKIFSPDFRNEILEIIIDGFFKNLVK